MLLVARHPGPVTGHNRGGFELRQREASGMGEGVTRHPANGVRLLVVRVAFPVELSRRRFGNVSINLAKAPFDFVVMEPIQGWVVIPIPVARRMLVLVSRVDS